MERGWGALGTESLGPCQIPGCHQQCGPSWPPCGLPSPCPPFQACISPCRTLAPWTAMLPARERVVPCDAPLTPRGWLKCGRGPCSGPVCCVTPKRKVPGGRRPSAGRLFPQPAKVRSGGFPALSTGLTLVLGAPLLAHAAQTRVRTETPALGR